MMRAFWVLAVNSFREARRNRISVVVAAFAVALLLSSTLLTEVTVYTFDRVLTDFGLGTMSITLVLLSVFLSSGQLSREIERKTIFLIVSKPVSRGQFLVARFTGNAMTLAAMLSAMGVVFAVQMVLYGRNLTLAHGVAIGMLLVELMVISSIGFLMSSFSSQMVSSVVTTGVWFAGHLSADIYTLSGKSESLFLKGLGRAVYYVLPNLERLNFKPEAAYEVLAPASRVVPSALYGVAYMSMMIALAVVFFSRRDFK